MTNEPQSQPGHDPGLRRMMKWVFITLIVVVVLAIVVVQMTLWWFSRS